MVSLDPGAARDLEEAEAWYAARAAAVHDAFHAEVDSAFAAIAQAARRYHALPSGCRKYVLRRFPYSIFCREFDDTVVVFAVAHHRREPSYWIDRLGRQ